MESSKTRNQKHLNVEIGRRLRAVRLGFRQTQAEVAAALGYAGPTTIHYMECGAKVISAADLAVIAAHFNQTIRSMFPKGSVR